MPRNKPPERTPQAAEPPPLASPPPQAEVWRPRHRLIAAQLAEAVAGRDPDQACAALAALSPADATARRAVRSAWVAVLRGAAKTTPAAEARPLPDPVAVFSAPPPPPPKAGVLNTLALDQAARMLLAASATEGDAPETAATGGAAEPDRLEAAVFTPTPLATPSAIPLADLSLFDAVEEEPATGTPPDPKPNRRKAKATDPAAAAALLADAAVPALPKKPPSLDLSAQFAALDGPEGN